MKKLINKNISLVIVLLIGSRVVFQPYGPDATYIDEIIFLSIKYLFTACALYYIGITHKCTTTRKVACIAAAFFLVLLLEELYFIGKPKLHEEAHRNAYWEGNLYILVLFVVSFIFDKRTTLFRYGKVAIRKLGEWYIFLSNRSVDS